MSLNKFTDSTIEKKWMNINCNDLKAETFDAGSVTLDNLVVVETKASSISGNLASASPLLNLQNTNATNGAINVGVNVQNATGDGIKLVAINGPTPSSAIWSMFPLSLTTFTSPGTITLVTAGNTPDTSVILSGDFKGVTVQPPLTLTNQPYKWSTQAVAQSIPNTTLTTVVFDTDNKTQGGLTRVGGVFTVPVAGVYQVTYSCQWTTNATGIRESTVYINNNIATSFGYSAVAGYAAAAAITQNTLNVYLSANDNIRVQANQSSGGALSVSATLSVIKIA